MHSLRKLYWYCQVGGWITYACFYFYINSVGYIDNLLDALLYCFFIATSGMAITVLYRWLILKLNWLNLPLQKIYINVLIAVILMSIAMTACNFLIERLTFPQFTQDVTFIFLTRYFGSWLQVFFVYTVIYHLYIYYQKTIAAEKAKNEAEFNALTAQINPHFYFNTLNNLYGLAIEKSAKTEEAILRLSNIMEYIIYDCRCEKVTLDKEIAFIESYIELEKLRYGTDLKIKFMYNVNNKQIKIAPLLLIPFVENAFKHGAEKQAQNAWIKINAVTHNNNFMFEVSNSVKYINNKKGIGLDNVKKRLNFTYPNAHKLHIKKTQNEFCIQLSIVL